MNPPPAGDLIPPPAAPPSNSTNPSERVPWYERFTLLNFTLLLFVLGLLASLGVLKGSGRDIDYAASTARVFGRMLPPDFSWTGIALAGLLETAQIAVWATFVALVVALPLSMATASTIAPKWIALPVRLLMNLVRTVPSLIWALIAVNIVGANALAGVLALGCYSLGYLVKFFSDAFESANMKVFQSLRAMGAGRVQAFMHGLWPQAKPLIWSSTLFMFEYNIRSGSIIGWVGAGGIGLTLHALSEAGDWPGFSCVILILLVPVTLLDLLGNYIRKRLTHSQPREEAQD